MTAVLPARTAPQQRHPDRPGRPVPPARPRPGRHLRPVERPRPRRAPAVPALVGVGMVIAALLALAVMHALLIGGQVRLDGLHGDVASETEAIRRLELRVAELESPDRVLDVARQRLGMVQPAEVGYLLPVEVPGAPDEPVRVAAAETREPEPVAGTAPSAASPPALSPEQAEVARALDDGDEVAVRPRATGDDPEDAEGGRDG